MFSKRHYEIFAEMVRLERMHANQMHEEEYSYDRWEDFLISTFKKDNERFDENKFREACAP